MNKKHKAYVYASSVVNGNITAPKYVILQAKEFLNIADGNDDKYFISDKKIKIVNGVLKILKMAKGLKSGQRIYDALSGFQWLMLTAVFCCVHRDNPKQRKYETVILEIARKNAKTFLVALIFIILFLTEPKFSRFFSVAPDGSLSKEVKLAIEEILKSSPDIDSNKNFKIRRDNILCLINNNIFTPLNYAAGRLDGRLPNAFLADEVGALPNNYAIEAMRSGQGTAFNKLGFIISTKYHTFDNPFEVEIKVLKDKLDGVRQDDKIFGLLFEPDNPDDWATDINVIKHSNPLSLDLPEFMNDLIEKREKAITYESFRENFLTKHCNIIYQGIETESYIDIKYVNACEVDEIDWNGRTVYLGVDLSMTTDNTAVAMVAIDDDGKIIADVMPFIPEKRMLEKSKTEKTDYFKYVKDGACIACGDYVIDYSTVENYVFEIENKYNVKIAAIGFDRYNALSSAQKWENGAKDSTGVFKQFNTVIIKQHSSVLHPATKLLSEYIMNGNFKFKSNELLKINFQNARCTYDTNLNRYVNKKRSNGKIDMVVALINAVHMLNENELLSETTDYFVQW